MNLITRVSRFAVAVLWALATLSATAAPTIAVPAERATAAAGLDATSLVPAGYRCCTVKCCK